LLSILKIQYFRASGDELAHLHKIVTKFMRLDWNKIVTEAARGKLQGGSVRGTGVHGVAGKSVCKSPRKARAEFFILPPKRPLLLVTAQFPSGRFERAHWRSLFDPPTRGADAVDSGLSRVMKKAVRLEECGTDAQFVIPAKAGIQCILNYLE